MRFLRFVLLGLALVVFAAIGWRLSQTAAPSRNAATIAADQPRPTPVVPAPTAPTVATPTPSAAPATPANPAQPHAVEPPAMPAAPATPQPPAAPAQATPPAGAMTAADARKAIETQLQSAPDLARVFDALKAEFPAVAERTLGTAIETLRAKGEVPTADDFIAAAMRDLRQNAGVLAAHAGPEALIAIFEAKAATLADLEAADPRICADYLFGGTSPEFGDFVISHRALVARSALAMIAAMADGRARQVNWDMPSPADYQAIEKGLAAKGLSAAEIGALLDGKPLDPPPSDTRLCDNTRAYLDVMHAMPVDARNRVYGLAADLLARS